MTTIKKIFPENGWQPMIPASAENNFIHSPESAHKKDLPANLNLNSVIIRSAVTIFLPIAALLVDKTLVIYTAPVIAYLFTSVILRFCIIKYVWERYAKHQPSVAFATYPEDSKYPAESLSSITNF